MGYAALALAILGFVLGTKFRIIVLLPIVVLLLVASIVVSVVRAFSIMDTVLIIILAQSILQCGYFLGLIAHAVRAAARQAPRSRNDRRRGRAIWF